MASKNLLPVVALCGALATGTPLVAAWATPVMADSTSGPKLRTKSVERHCVRCFDASRNLNLGMLSS